MKKKFTITTIAVALMLILSSCSSSGAAKATEAYSAQVKDAVVEEDYSGSMAENPAPEASPDGQTSVIVDPGNIPSDGKKIIYTVSMGLEAKDVRKAIDNITKEAGKLGGYVSDSNFRK